MIWVLPSPTCTPIAPRASTRYLPPSLACPPVGGPSGSGSVLISEPVPITVSRRPAEVVALHVLSRPAGRGTRCPDCCGHRSEHPARPGRRPCTFPPALPHHPPGSSAPAPPPPDHGHDRPQPRPAPRSAALAMSRGP